MGPSAAGIKGFILPRHDIIQCLRGVKINIIETVLSRNGEPSPGSTAVRRAPTQSPRLLYSHRYQFVAIGIDKYQRPSELPRRRYPRTANDGRRFLPDATIAHQRVRRNPFGNRAPGCRQRASGPIRCSPSRYIPSSDFLVFHCTTVPRDICCPKPG